MWPERDWRKWRKSRLPLWLVQTDLAQNVTQFKPQDPKRTFDVSVRPDKVTYKTIEFIYVTDLFIAFKGQHLGLFGSI